jgi:hypothetical protein
LKNRCGAAAAPRAHIHRQLMNEHKFKTIQNHYHFLEIVEFKYKIELPVAIAASSEGRDYIDSRHPVISNVVANFGWDPFRSGSKENILLLFYRYIFTLFSLFSTIPNNGYWFCVRLKPLWRRRRRCSDAKN